MFHWHDPMRVLPAYREALRRVSLDRTPAVFDRLDGVISAWSRTTCTRYVPDTGGGPGFFVKYYLYPTWRARLRCLLRGTLLGPHRGQAEFALLEEMRSRGLPAVRPVACGRRSLGPVTTGSFLITEAVPNACDLTRFSRSIATGERPLSADCRAQMVRRLAEQVAAMHASGFTHGQLFWRNILVRFEPPHEPEYFFLDARPHSRRRWPLMRRCPWLTDLATLAASAQPFTTRRERAVFLHGYLRARGLQADRRRLAGQIESLAARWQAHETHRIRMSDQFHAWQRRLAIERGWSAAGGVG